MSNITIRRISRENQQHCIPAIVNVFRDDEVVPWSKPDECAAFISRSVKRGFYMAAAYDGDQLVGYNEWIETFDKGRKILFLGIMQVDCALRGRGIGGAMLADGEAYAKSIGASTLRTMPEDERANRFYNKHGFLVTDGIYACSCPTAASPGQAQDGKPVTMTLDIVNAHEFIFGLCQSSGRHMYEITNHIPATSRWRFITARHPEGYLQFRYEEGTKTATALYWSNESVTAGTLSAILACGHAAGFGEISFYFRSAYQDLFAKQIVTQEGTELEKKTT